METSGGIGASLGGRYATALFDLAKGEGRIDAVSASLATLTDALRQSGDFAALIRSPLVGRDEAGRAVAAVAAELNIDGTTTKLLGVLARDGRLAQLPVIARLFRELAARHRGELAAAVTSAHPLAPDQLDALAQGLRRRFGREVAVETSVDPAILGGLIVKVGSQQIDGSIRTKLNALAHAMKG